MRRVQADHPCARSRRAHQVAPTSRRTRGAARVPMIGPSPSIAVTASTIARCGRMVALRSRIDVVDAVHVQDVLRPAVDRARHHAEEVLHAGGHPRPVMRLQLRHRDDEVGREQLHRQRQLAQAGEPAPQRHLAHVVMIEIDEADPFVPAGDRRGRCWSADTPCRGDGPGPSPTTTDRGAGARGTPSAAPATTSGWVLIAVPRSYSTRFGLRNTRRPRTSTPSSREAAADHAAKSTA